MLDGVCGLELRVTQEQRLLRQQRRRQRRRQQSRRNTHSPLTTTSMVCGFGAIRAVLVTGCRNLLVLLLHIAPRADTSFAMCSARGVVRVRTQRWMTTKRPTMRLPEMLAASVHAGCCQSRSPPFCYDCSTIPCICAQVVGPGKRWIRPDRETYSDSPDRPTRFGGEELWNERYASWLARRGLDPMSAADPRYIERLRAKYSLSEL